MQLIIGPLKESELHKAIGFEMAEDSCGNENVQTNKQNNEHRSRVCLCLFFFVCIKFLGSLTFSLIFRPLIIVLILKVVEKKSSDV